MNREILFEAIGNLDDTVIGETEKKPTAIRQCGVKKNRWVRWTALGFACAACIALMIVAAISRLPSASPDVQLEGPLQSTITLPPTNTTEPSSQSQKNTVTFLHALGDGTQKTELIENLKYPYRTLIRIRDISGITDAQFDDVHEEETLYINEFFSQYPEDALNGWGRYRGENVLITTLSAGGFILQFDDIEAVESVEISVTDMGVLHLRNRVENYCCTAVNKLGIHLDQDGLVQATEQSQGDLEMFWSISPHAAECIKKDPSIKLSALQDTINIRVCFKDGSEQSCAVDMLIEDNGEVYMIYRGASVTA